MKINLTEKKSLVHLIVKWRRKIADWYEQVGPDRFFKFVIMYGLYLLIVLTFDYLWMPWLVIKFQYLTFFPLCISLFVVCLFGLWLYEFFQEDIFFKEKISEWMLEEGVCHFVRKLKKQINDNPRLMFIVVAIWWSPLHAYVYFRRSKEIHFGEVIRLIGKGSLLCAFFWGVIIDIIVTIWHLGKFIMKLHP